MLDAADGEWLGNRGVELVAAHAVRLCSRARGVIDSCASLTASWAPIRVEDRTALPLDSGWLRDGLTIAVAPGMKWLVLIIAFASGCRAVGDTLSCIMNEDEQRRAACEDDGASDYRYEQALRIEAERRAVRERDEDMNARREYRAALGPCSDGDARACFTTALYEDRHGAPSTQVEARYRFACVEGIGRACFMAGTHAQTRVSTDVIEKRSAESIAARQLALTSFTHGCELRDGESCRAGYELDSARTDLLDTACAAHYRWACTMRGR